LGEYLNREGLSDVAGGGLLDIFVDKPRVLDGDLLKGMLGPGSGQVQRTEDRREKTDAGRGMTDDRRVAL
jgi:hypothetical protein